MPDAPASRAVVNESSSFLGTRTITSARPSEWACAAWMALYSLSQTENQSFQHKACSNLLMQFEPVEHAVLDVDPDEVGLCGR